MKHVWKRVKVEIVFGSNFSLLLQPFPINKFFHIFFNVSKTYPYLDFIIIKIVVITYIRKDKGEMFKNTSNKKKRIL